MYRDHPFKAARFRLRCVFRDTRAATAVEYGLIVALIVIALLAGLSNLGTATGSMWKSVSSKVAQAS
jgi:pilus assembly protein Flp/PilA